MSIKTCYLCNGIMTRFLVKNGYTIYRCMSCGLGMTDLQKDYRSFVKGHYSKGYFTGDPRYSAYVSYKDDKPIVVRNMRKFLREVKQYKPHGKLLDVGCAMGFFVELALANGYDAYGFDPSDFAVAEAKNLVGEKRIALATTETVEYPKKSFDVITLFDVFEHLADPQKDIAKLLTWLKDDGIIVIATGDSQSLAAKVFKRRWTFYIPPQHLFFFSRSTLDSFLKRLGLQPVRWFRIGKWLSIRYVLHLARTTGESKLARLLYPLIQKMKISKIPLFVPMGDNMVVIAQKAV